MAVTIRPFRDTDAPAIISLTLAAIRETGLRAYSAEQVAAWSDRFSPDRLLAQAASDAVVLTAADGQDRAVAYTVLAAGGHVDMLYCHPDHSRRGIALALLEAAEAAARAKSEPRLFTEASELARPVFSRAGFAMVARREFTIAFEGREIPIHNYAMEKILGECFT